MWYYITLPQGKTENEKQLKQENNRMKSSPTFQKCTFAQGGFVLHKITGSFKGRCSAWYDAAGNLEAAEQYYWNVTRDVERDVRKDGPIWTELARHGQLA